jgi:hypothetical protein
MTMKRNLAIVLSVTLAATSAYAGGLAPRAGAAGESGMSSVFPQPSFIDYPEMATMAELAPRAAPAPDGRIATSPAPSFVDCPPVVPGAATASAGPTYAPDGSVLPQPSFTDCPPIAVDAAAAGSGPSRR